MSDLTRVSLSLERSLLERIEQVARRRGYENRSEFARDLFRQALVEEEWRGAQDVVGTITLLYDHHVHHLAERLTDLQHHSHGAVLATTHVHLDRNLCAEMILVRGKARSVRKLSDELGRQRGVLHASLSMGSTGRRLT